MEKNIVSKMYFHHKGIKLSKNYLYIYSGLRTDLSHLFTYQNHKNSTILDTTNALKGGVFLQIKNMISLHRGLSKSLKLNLVDYYLVHE